MEYNYEAEVKRFSEIPSYIKHDGIKWVLIPVEILLKVLSMWPIKNTPINLFLIVTSFANNILVTVAEVFYIRFNLQDLGLFAYGFISLLATFENLIRQIILIYHRKRIIKLLNRIYYEFWTTHFMKTATRIKLQKLSLFLVVYYTGVVVSGALCVYLIALRALITNKRSLLKDGEYFTFLMESPMNEIVYVWRTVTTIIHSIIICTFDFFFVTLTWNCIVQFRLLKIVLRDFVLDKIKSEGDEVGALVKCIIHHNKIISACDDMEAIFTFFILFLFLSSIVTVCFSIFIVSVRPDEIGALSIYFLLHFFQLFAYCFLSNHLADESTDLCNAIFQCGWHSSNSSKTLKHHLIMMMLRSRREIHLSAGGFGTANLSSFIKIIQLAFSVFTFLNTMLEKGKSKNVSVL